jgi:TPR repeat protein
MGKDRPNRSISPSSTARAMLARRLGVLSASLLVQRSAALHLPSAHLLATTARDACAALSVPKDEWLEPEDAALAVGRALSAIRLPAAEAEGDAPPPLPPLPLQGEFVFSTDVHADRYAEAEEAAFAGDARAQHTLGLLLFGGVGGCEPDARQSAYWHAAAAAQGNLDALATLGGCVRRGAGAAQDEATGVALIEAAAEARTKPNPTPTPGPKPKPKPEPYPDLNPNHAGGRPGRPLQAGRVLRRRHHPYP